ncbi:MAG: hypothetical protein JNN15_19030 [Blastocatellia bacterium]|nr:hypothetical protein [Blastocatellia bacterium]
MMKPINWELLASQMSTLRENGGSGSSRHAQRAIEMLLGEDNIKQAVEYYITGKPGSELVRSVLSHIRPWSAMKHCYDIYKSDINIENKRVAIELLRVIADNRALEWIPEFLEDQDPDIQNWGLGVLDQLLWLRLVTPEEADRYLQIAEKHKSFHVREKLEFIKAYLKKRESKI